MGHAIKSNILGDKFAWFTEQLEDDKERHRLTPTEFKELINVYVLLLIQNEYRQIEINFCLQLFAQI